MEIRGVGLTALRGAALTLSIGIVAVLMVRASSGCSDRSDIGADPARSAADTTGAAGGAEAIAPPPPEKGTYFPAGKSMGGEGRRLLGPSATTSAHPIEFFPATKSGRPIPPQTQQQQQVSPGPPAQPGTP